MMTGTGRQTNVGSQFRHFRHSYYYFIQLIVIFNPVKIHRLKILFNSDILLIF